MNRQHKSEPFVKVTKSVLERIAQCDLSINGRRLLDFLMLEHMRHGGKKNGELLAPYRQLVEFGIGAQYIAATIAELEQSGLVNCRRGTGRAPNTYALAWLPLSDGSEPNVELPEMHYDRNAQAAVVPYKRNADYPTNVMHKARSALQT